MLSTYPRHSVCMATVGTCLHDRIRLQMLDDGIQIVLVHGPACTMHCRD